MTDITPDRAVGTGAGATAGTGVTVRLAYCAEAEAIARVVREGFRTEAERYGVEIPPMREVAGDILAAFDSGDVVLVAESDGLLVGTVRGHMQDDGSIMVRRLSVLPDVRRRGVARDLMVALEAEYPDVERLELFTGVETTPAITLYESLGYARTREEEVQPGVRLVYLEKRRSPGARG